MTWKGIFGAVTIAALIGMVMGGLFGLAAGKLAPDFFHRPDPVAGRRAGRNGDTAWRHRRRPARGALGCFGVAVQTALQWKVRGGSGK